MTTQGKVMSKPEAGPSLSPGLLVWYGFLLAAAALGGTAVAMRVSQGLVVTHLTSEVPWGTWVAFYIFFVGLSAGAFLLSSLIHVFDMRHLEKVGRDATLVALIAMLLALLFIWMDIGRMDRFWHALVYGNITSVLAYEVRFYLVYILLLAAELWLAMRRDLVLAARGTGGRAVLARMLKLGSRDLSAKGVERDRRWPKILGAIGIPIAIFGVHGGTGLLFAVVKARHYWNTALFPVVFVVSALVSGTALVTAVYLIKTRLAGKKVDAGLLEALSRLMILFLLIDIGLQFFEFIVGFYGLQEEALHALHYLMVGPQAEVFWLVQVGLGMVVPILLYSMKAARRSPAAMLVAALAVVIGILGVRFNIVLPALMPPLLPGLPAGQYYPSWLEWAAAGGVIAFGVLLYTLAVRWLPIDEIEGGDGNESRSKLLAAENE